MIMKERNVKVDGKVRTDMCYPAGFMGESKTNTTTHSKNLNCHLSDTKLLLCSQWLAMCLSPLPVF